MWRGVVLEGDAVGVLGRESEDGVALHLEGAVAEGAHGVDPRLLRRVHERRVDPRRHLVQLQKETHELV